MVAYFTVTGLDVLDRGKSNIKKHRGKRRKNQRFSGLSLCRSPVILF
jgi:hypothetical protein